MYLVQYNTRGGAQRMPWFCPGKCNIMEIEGLYVIILLLLSKGFMMVEAESDPVESLLFCLSDNHSTEQCQENQNSVAAALLWYHTPSVPGPVFGGVPREKLYNSFNVKGGPRCNFCQCKLAHKCSVCQGPPHQGLLSKEHQCSKGDSLWRSCSQTAKDRVHSPLLYFKEPGQY